MALNRLGFEDQNCFPFGICIFCGVLPAQLQQFGYCVNCQTLGIPGSPGRHYTKCYYCDKFHAPVRIPRNVEHQHNEPVHIPRNVEHQHNERVHIPRNVEHQHNEPVHVHRTARHQLPSRVVYSNPQTVHNHTIQTTIAETILILIENQRTKTHQPKTHNDVDLLISSDKVLTDFTKASLVEYSSDRSVHISLELTFHDILVIVWNRIVVLENSDEIKAVLNKEMEDAANMCFTGRISRLVNCLNGFDPLVKIQISDTDQIGTIIVSIRKQLQNNKKYTVEKHKEIARKRLIELGIDVGVIEEWLESIV